MRIPITQELLLYLLQLIQALKFESSATDQPMLRSSTNVISHDDSGLADFLIDRSVRNPILGNRFHWYLMVEVALEDKLVAKVYGKVWYKFMEKIKKVLSYFTKLIRIYLIRYPSQTMEQSVLTQ